MKTNKLKAILKALTPDETEADFKVFDEQVGVLKEQLKEKIQVKAVDDVNAQLEKFRRRIDLNPLLETMQKIKEGFDSRHEELTSVLQEKTEELESLISSNDTTSSSKVLDVSQRLETEISSLKTQLGSFSKSGDVLDLQKNITDLQGTNDKLTKAVETLLSSTETTNTSISNNKKDSEKSTVSTLAEIEKLRKELLQRINNLGGGAMNRQIFIGSVDPLTRYTDINLKAGSNVTITYANNNTTKKVDVTIASSGGGGGSVRSINSVSTNTAAGSTSGTDYVYLCSGTMTLTLPTAVGNTNLYTVKNVGTGTVTVATAAQTIDGSSSITLPVQYTAVDLISDTANWNVT